MNKNSVLGLYFKLRFFSALFFSTIITVNLVYQATVVGLNPLQLVLVGTLLESVCFIFEIPTGVVADLHSRKKSVIIGVFLIGSGFVFEGIFATFLGVLIAQIIWGIGATFVSGAREAWIADEVGEREAGRAFMKGQKANQLGAFLGIILSMLLANIDIRLPIILGGILYASQAVYLFIFMPENNFKPTPPQKRENWKAMKKNFLTGLDIIKTDKALLSMVVIVMIVGMFSEGFDRLWTPFLIDNFAFPVLWNLKPVIWFGIISLVATLMATLMLGFVDRKTDMADQKSVTKSLFLVNLFLILTVFAFGMSGNFTYAFFAYCFAFMFKESFGPLSATLINRNLKPEVRATVFSFSSQMDSLGQIMVGPFLGLIAVAISIKTGILAAGLVLVSSLLFYGYLSRAHRAEEIRA